MPLTLLLLPARGGSMQRRKKAASHRHFCGVWPARERALAYAPALTERKREISGDASTTSAALLFTVASGAMLLFTRCPAQDAMLLFTRCVPHRILF